MVDNIAAVVFRFLRSQYLPVPAHILVVGCGSVEDSVGVTWALANWIDRRHVDADLRSLGGLSAGSRVAFLFFSSGFLDRIEVMCRRLGGPRFL